MSKWNPDEHLPECGVTRYPICICDRLRACEQRVREDEQRIYDNEGRDPFAAGLDAARDAVAAFKGHTAYAYIEPNGYSDAPVARVGFTQKGDGRWIDQQDALTVIDALREEQ